MSHQNFGLKGKKTAKRGADYDNWFWESKSQKKLRLDQKRAEIERMRAETNAMNKIITEPEESGQNGMQVGKIALIAGLVLLAGIGIAIALKRKGSKAALEPEASGKLTAEDLIV